MTPAIFAPLIVGFEDINQRSFTVKYGLIESAFGREVIFKKWLGLHTFCLIVYFIIKLSLVERLLFNIMFITTSCLTQVYKNVN